MEKGQQGVSPTTLLFEQLEPSVLSELTIEMELFANSIQSMGLNCKATHTNYLLLKERLSNVNCIEFIKYFKLQNLVVQQIVKEQVFGTKDQVRLFCSFFGSEPDGMEMEKIDQDDLAEIYNRDNQQIFRSINFFKYCSYTLEELITIPWYNLYSRNRFIHERLVEIATNTFANNLKKSVDLHFEPYELRELYSTLKSSCVMLQKMIIPIFNSEKNCTVGGINTMKVLRCSLFPQS